MNWNFTSMLLLSYLLIFHLWMLWERAAIVISSIVATAVLGALLVWFARRDYFLNRWDIAFHALVILDILLEGCLIAVHDNNGFYLCALAFAVVLVGYRLKQSRRNSVADLPTPSEQ